MRRDGRCTRDHDHLGRPNPELVQQVLHSQWKLAGIDVRIRNQPARVFFGDTVSRRRFPAMAMFAWISGPESVPRSTLHSEEVPTAENGWAGQNYGGYRNAEVDALIEAIEVELDESKRRLLWHRLQAIYADDLPALPLFFRPTHSCCRHGWRASFPPATSIRARYGSRTGRSPSDRSDRHVLLSAFQRHR